MSSSGMGLAQVTGHVRKLRGESQPALVQASDGFLYVVKFTNHRTGENLPFNESMGAEVYRAGGLESPGWKPLLVSDAFLDENPGCWWEVEGSRQRPEAGVCFASRFVGAEGLRLIEILPGDAYKRLRNGQSFWLAWLIDACAHHAGHRQALFLVHSSSEIDVLFIDHGDLFGGVRGQSHPDFLAARYLDMRVYRDVPANRKYLATATSSLDADRLWRTAKALPEEWQTPSALAGFSSFLDNISDRLQLKQMLDAMIECCLPPRDRPGTATGFAPGLSMRAELPGTGTL